MKYEHKPVLADECIKGLNIKEDGIYVDATLGGAGHSSLICECLSEKGLLIGIDRDIEAIENAKSRLETYSCRKIFVHSNFNEVESILKGKNISKIDGALIDLGVSSYQLDNPDRGFSYMNDALLDMRMDASDDVSNTKSLTAHQVVNEYPEKELTRILREYGEEKWSSRIAKFIVNARSERPIETTGELTEIIKAAIPASARREGPHPAKRSFQSIRVEVNNELRPLGDAVDSFINAMGRGGRLAIISFHSLEDRIVKERFRKREKPCECPPGLPECTCGKKPDVKRITRKPITASPEELEYNPRARSAKLRVVEKI